MSFRRQHDPFTIFVLHCAQPLVGERLADVFLLEIRELGDRLQRPLRRRRGSGVIEHEMEFE